MLSALSDEPSTQTSKSDSDKEKPNLTQNESSYKTSDSGSGTNKPNYFWPRTTTKDTEPNEPTRNKPGK